MKFIKIKLQEHIVAVKESDWPVIYRHCAPDIGLTMEVRMNGMHAYIYAWAPHEGLLRYTGMGEHCYRRGPDLFRQLSEDAHEIARQLHIPDAHAWALVEQFPVFCSGGISPEEAEALEKPIQDLAAAGASPREIVESLGITRHMYEFMTGTKYPPDQPSPAEADDSMDDY